MKAILGTKIGMTQIFSADGVVLPVTMVKTEPNTVVQIKSLEKDGYQAVQLGYGKKKNITKPILGHTKGKKFRYLREFDIPTDKVKVGDSFGAEIFTVGEAVNVIGVSKGKGFQGVVKRWGFSGSPASHGHKDQLRMPGSIGAGGPAHVFKGVRMGGRMGTDQFTIKNLEIVKIDGGILYVKGALPGARNSLVSIISEQEFELKNSQVEEKEIPTTEESSAEIAPEIIETADGNNDNK